MRVVVLGAGFGGLELSTRLSQQFGDGLEIVLIDNTEHFVFGYSKLDVMFGKTLPERVQHAYVDIVKPGVRFVSATVTSIDAAGKSVVTDAGTFDADILVIALGADLDPAATPGLVEGGHEFYTEAGAFALREVLADFAGGRVIVAVTSAPFKCPPAPSETALLMHDLLVSRGARERSEISLVMPLPVPIPPSPAASKALLATFVERGIGWYPQAAVRALDCDRQMLVLGDGSEMPYDVCLGVPKHRVPAVVQESGLTVDGWIPVDPYTLETSFPDVYAVGDVTSIGTPKAGVFAEGQAAVVANAIADRIRGGQGRSPSRYDGHGLCYLEFGSGNVGAVDVTFTPDSPPVGHLLGPDVSYVADKIEFGNTRVRRWFDHEWDR